MAPVMCDNCGADRRGIPNDAPCTCGAYKETTPVGGATVMTRSSFPAPQTRPVATSTTVNIVFSAPTPTIGIGFNTDQPWQELWQSALRRLDELDRCANGLFDDPDPAFEWRRIPLDFCMECWDLKDWLQADPAVPPAVQDLAGRYAINHPAISRAGDVANTKKHRGRKPNAIVARIDKMEVAPGGRRTFRIDWTEPSGTKGSRDALDLATTVVAEWRRFFSTHGLDENG